MGTACSSSKGGQLAVKPLSSRMHSRHTPAPSRNINKEVPDALMNSIVSYPDYGAHTSALERNRAQTLSDYGTQERSQQQEGVEGRRRSHFAFLKMNRVSPAMDARTVPVTKRGVAFEVFRNFFCENRIACELTTAEVVEKFIKPQTKHHNCSFFKIVYESSQKLKKITGESLTGTPVIALTLLLPCLQNFDNFVLQRISW
jgi:hypothetical protein